MTRPPLFSRRPATQWMLAVSIIVALSHGSLRAQPEESVPAEPIVEQPPAEMPEAPPPPGEEVMRPTADGLRLTPELSRAIGATIIHENFEGPLGLTDRQHAQMAAILGAEIEGLLEADDHVVPRMIEYWLNHADFGQDGMASEHSPELAKHLRESLDPFQEKTKRFMQRANRILHPDQRSFFNEQLTEFNSALDRFRAFLDHGWKPGPDKPWNPFRDFEAADSQHDGPPGDATAEERAAFHARQRAEGRAEDTIRERTAMSWRPFMARIGDLFGFTPEQWAQAESILRDHRQQADEIMTADWHDRLRANRVAFHGSLQLNPRPKGPWLFHLEEDFEAMVAPIDELTRSFYRAILELPTNDQRAAVTAKLREILTKHGFEPAQGDLALLQLAPRNEGM